VKVLISILYLAVCVSTFAQPATAPANGTTTASSSAPIKVASLHFLAGHWQGHAEQANLEQTCSISDPAVVVCMFQMMDSKGTQMVEFYTLRDTAAGVEERVRFYSPDLNEEPGDGLTMKLASASGNAYVFENPNGTYPKRSTLTRTADDEFHSHIELIDPQGKTSNIDAYWKRVK
jgi:hypothetical protein